MANPPKLTPEQRQAALAKAATARKVRAEIKARLKMGSLSLPEVLEMAENDPLIAKTKVLAIIESMPGIGKVTARKKMEEIGIAESRRLGGVGPQQKKGLLEAFS